MCIRTQHVRADLSRAVLQGWEGVSARILKPINQLALPSLLQGREGLARLRKLED